MRFCYMSIVHSFEYDDQWEILFLSDSIDGASNEMIRKFFSVLWHGKKSMNTFMHFIKLIID